MLYYSLTVIPVLLGQKKGDINYRPSSENYTISSKSAIEIEIQGTKYKYIMQIINGLNLSMNCFSINNAYLNINITVKLVPITGAIVPIGLIKDSNMTDYARNLQNYNFIQVGDFVQLHLHFTDSNGKKYTNVVFTGVLENPTIQLREGYSEIKLSCKNIFYKFASQISVLGQNNNGKITFTNMSVTDEKKFTAIIGDMIDSSIAKDMITKLKAIDPDNIKSTNGVDGLLFKGFHNYPDLINKDSKLWCILSTGKSKAQAIYDTIRPYQLTAYQDVYGNLNILPLSSKSFTTLDLTDLIVNFQVLSDEGSIQNSVLCQIFDLALYSEKLAKEMRNKQTYWAVNVPNTFRVGQLIDSKDKSENVRYLNQNIMTFNINGAQITKGDLLPYLVAMGKKDNPIFINNLGGTENTYNGIAAIYAAREVAQTCFDMFEIRVQVPFEKYIKLVLGLEEASQSDSLKQLYQTPFPELQGLLPKQLDKLLPFGKVVTIIAPSINMTYGTDFLVSQIHISSSAGADYINFILKYPYTLTGLWDNA